MRRQARSLVALGLVLVLALTAYLLLRSGGGEGAPAPDPAPDSGEALYAMGGVPQRHAVSVSVENEHGAYTIENAYGSAEDEAAAGESAYTIEGIDPADLNGNLIKTVFTAVGSMEAKQRIAEQGAELSRYGLDRPRARVEAVYADGGVAVLAIGDDAPGGEGTYVLGGEEEVYLVYTSSLTNLFYPRLGFVNRTVTSGGTATTVLREVSITGGEYGEEPLIIRREADEDELAALLGAGVYTITSPVQAPADSGAVSALGSLFALTAGEVVAQADGDDTLAAYGLLEPRLTVAVETDDADAGSFTLHISDTDAEGYVYLLREGRPFLYRLEAQVLTFLDLTLFDYRDKDILQPPIDSVAQLVVETPAGTYSFLLEQVPDGEETALRVTLDGDEVDTDAFRGFYRTVISAEYAGEIAPAAGEDGGEPPEDDGADALLRVTFRYREGGENTIACYPGEARRPRVRLDGGEAYYIASRYVDRVADDAAKVAASYSG